MIDILFRLAYNSGHKAVPLLRDKKARIQAYCRIAAKKWEDLTMSTKFSRKTFLKGSVAGLGMMALNVCTAGAASAAEPAAAAAEDTNSLNLIPKKAASVKVRERRLAGRAGVPQLEGVRR